MRIAIDCRTILNPAFGEGAGVGHYVYYLVKNLLRLDQKNEYVLFFDDRLAPVAARGFTANAPNAEAVFFPFGKFKKYLPLAYSHFLVAAAIAKKHPDLFHLPAGALPLALRGVPAVATVHDLAIYAHPEWFPKQDFSVKVTFPKTLANARRLIAVSGATADDLVKRFQIPARKISTIYPGVEITDRALYGSPAAPIEFSDLARRYKLKKPYFLYLGTLDPRKNVKLLVEAFVAAWNRSQAVRGFELIIAGKPGWSDGGALAAAEKAGLITKGGVRAIGYVDQAHKRRLVLAARAFFLPSLAEGFGLPALEAMSLGVPVVLSDIPVFRETAGQAALFADPVAPESFAAAIVKIAEDENFRQRLAKLGPEQVKKYSWETAARQTIEVYERVVSGAVGSRE